MHEHWNDDELLAYLYGVREGPAPACPECRTRLERWDRLRSQWVAALPGVSELRLREQRQSILRRAGQPVWRPPLVPAFGALAMVVMAVFLARPEPKTPTELARQQAADESRFFTEIYQSLESPEPRAASPIRALFEEDR